MFLLLFSKFKKFYKSLRNFAKTDYTGSFGKFFTYKEEKYLLFYIFILVLRT